MAECMLSIVAEKGIIIIEVQYLVNTLKDLTFDNIYHEHYNYWSLTSLINFFTSSNVIRLFFELLQLLQRGLNFIL